MRNSMVAICLAACFLLAGCGGGGGAGTSPADTVSGVAAAGLAISGNVYLKDSSAVPRELAKSTANGAFSFDVTGLTKPFMLKVVGTANGRNYTLYSVAVDKGSANINPLSNLVVATAAAGADLSGIYAAPASGLSGVAAALGGALLDVQATLKPLLEKYGVAGVDPIGGSYQADGTGLDHMLDLVGIEVSPSGSATITESGSSPIERELATGFTTRSVSGTVTLDGSPFAGVTVTVADGALVYGSTATGADGSYLFGHVPQGSYTVTPVKSGYSFDRTGSTVAVAAADCQVPVFASYRPFSVSGTVTSSNGGGVAGVTVTARRDGTGTSVAGISDGAGRYVIAGLSSGSYTVTATRTDVADSRQVVFDPGSKGASISETGNWARVDFNADLATFALSGNVVTLSGGSAMPGVLVTLYTKTNSGTLLTTSDASFSTATDAGGNYSFSGIPSGYYALKLTQSGYGFALQESYATHGVTDDNFSISGANLTLGFTGRPVSDANGGVTLP